MSFQNLSWGAGSHMHIRTLESNDEISEFREVDRSQA